MSDAHALHEVIAERQIALVRADGSSEAITVRIGKPFPVEGSSDEWRCPYQIEGLGLSKTSRMTGVDSVQALLLTMQTILPELEHLAKREGGAISWLEDENGGFPDYRLSPSYQRRDGA